MKPKHNKRNYKNGNENKNIKKNNVKIIKTEHNFENKK